MKERPILFSAPMIRAIRERQKTQTRRVAKPQPMDGKFPRFCNGEWGLYLDRPHTGPYQHIGKCPYGVPGDRLWVKETLWIVPEPSVRELRDGADTWPKPMGPQSERIGYAADDPTVLGKDAGFGAHYREWGWKKRPAIFMPRWASRITLEITEVRVQRLQEISLDDCLAEGIEVPGRERMLQIGPINRACDEAHCRAHFSKLWDSINAKKHPWSSNPWVWCLTFKMLDDVRG